MKKRALKWIAGTLLAIAGLFAAADFGSARLLKPHIERYHRELAEIRRKETSYRRPAVFGEPIEQNAANWYRLALPHLTGTLQVIGPALRDGAGYEESATPSIIRACTESRSLRVQAALSSTQCDWELTSGLESLVAFKYQYEASALVGCLIVNGHDAAYKGDPRAAARFYLEGVAVSSDLGNGDDVMTGIAISWSGRSLLALAKLATRTDSARLLSDWWDDLLRFDGRLPDIRPALARLRLWTENAAALNELEARGGRLRNPIRASASRLSATLSLWLDRAFFEDLEKLEIVGSAEQALRLGESFKRGADRSHREVVREFGGGNQEALLVTDTFGVKSIYRATQASIRLQQWWLEHGSYPADAASLDLPSDVRYERSANGSGYKLIGPRTTLVERRPTV